jgi:hypothetical protein
MLANAHLFVAFHFIPRFIARAADLEFFLVPEFGHTFTSANTFIDTRIRQSADQIFPSEFVKWLFGLAFAYLDAARFLVGCIADEKLLVNKFFLVFEQRRR